MRYLLGLGSNRGWRRRNLARALEALEAEDISVLRVSSVYKTEPVDKGGRRWFFNLVAEVETSLEPLLLLSVIQAIEKKFGRPEQKRTGPRRIDIDILLAEDRVIRSEQLIVPHPRLEKRNFVLIPLAEISSSALHPVFKKTVAELKAESKDTARVKKLRRRVFGSRARI